MPKSNPAERLKEISKKIKEFHEPDHVNKCLEDDFYINVVETKENGKIRYAVTDNGKAILKHISDE